MSDRLSWRARMWAIWHTRPGHKPAGIIYDRHRAICTACGSEAPR